MKSLHSPRSLLQALLSQKPAQRDLTQFVELCTSLALPLIRKKICLGKLNLQILGMNEADVVYDCLAELFQRDERGDFRQIRTHFENHNGSFEICSDEELLISLRHLVFYKVNNNIIRLYSEADPTLGRILRNLKLALERDHLFNQVTRFGEAYLVPVGVDQLQDRPGMTLDFLKQEFSRVVLIHDNVPTMARKLHGIITEQEEYQRMVPVVSAALLFKEIYSLGWENSESTTVPVEIELNGKDIARVAEKVCTELQSQMRRTYVEKGKCSEETFASYIQAVKDILVHAFSVEEVNGGSYFEYFHSYLPQINKEKYLKEYRTVLEYLAKLGKQRMREKLRKI